jgi:hypothetical protein
MNANYRIYSAETIPVEDTARLGGYLKGREEAEMEADRQQILENLKDLESRLRP